MTASTSELEASEISSLSDRQDKILSILPFFPAVLSILGSATIIYLVTSEKKKSPYRRLLLGMSLCDIFFSITLPLQAFLLPKETSQRVWAIGSSGSCTALGFAQQFAFSAMIYNGFLSYYFLLTVRYGWKHQQLSKCIEPCMHGISIGFPLVTATVGAVKGFYHEVELGPGCWISDYPEGCNLPGSEIDCTSPTWAWMFGGSILIFVVLSLLVNNALLYWHVRSTIQVSKRRSSVRIIEESINFSMKDGVMESACSSNPSSALKGPDSSRWSLTGTPTPSVEDSQTRRVRAVATQAFLYVGSFVTAYVWTAILRIMESLEFDAEDEASIFPILVLQALFVPIQGFFNLLVYVRPRYLRARVDFPKESRYWAFRRALFGNKVKPISSVRITPGSTLTTRVGGATGAGTAHTTNLKNTNEEHFVTASPTSRRSPHFHVSFLGTPTEQPLEIAPTDVLAIRGSDKIVSTSTLGGDDDFTASHRTEEHQ